MKNLKPISCCLLALPLLAGAGQLAAQDLVASGAEPQLLEDGFGFTEGPIADPTGNVYFTDIPANTIHVWTIDGELETFRENTNGANGLFFDDQDRLYAAEGGAGRITRMDSEGNVTVLDDEYAGARFNSPNDIFVDDQGGVYFTDPVFGDTSETPQPGFNVYYRPPGGEAVPVETTLELPNGVIGTTDGKTLYIADTAGQTWAYDVGPPGYLSDKRLVADQGSDGLTLDEQGNLYLTGGDYITVYDPETGEQITQIEFPEAPANMTFGGPARDVLYVTARTGFYSLQMNVSGAY